MNSEIRRNMPLFPIGIVMKLTELTARQIRYYEQHGLVTPERTEGNQRLFSFNDVERLLEIKSLIEKGINMAGIKQMISPANAVSQEEAGKAQVSNDKADTVNLGDFGDADLAEMRRRIRMQLRDRRQGSFLLNRGELARFFGVSILKK